MAVNTCEICAETYPISHLGDHGMCRLCEIREPHFRRKIAAQVHALGGSAFMVESVARGNASDIIKRPGGMSDLTIPEFDPEPDGWHLTPQDVRHAAPGSGAI